MKNRLPFHRLLRRVSGGMAVFLLAITITAPWNKAFAQDDAAFFRGIRQQMERMSEDQLEEMLLFAAGNALFTLYHEGGHMLVSELGLPVLGQEEDAVDNLATVTMLGADTEDMDGFLTQAMIGWFLIAEEDYDSLVFYGEHDLDQQRGYQILCLMVGADPDAFAELARDLDLPDDRIDTCAQDYEQAAESWDFATEPFWREENDERRKINVVHEPAPEDLDLLALFLKEAELLESVANEFDSLYVLPEAVTFRAATCGVENAFWDPSNREVILCHELMAGFAGLYMAYLMDD